MLGAITGDVCGSIYEFNPVEDFTFKLFTANSQFTDDTVLTVAITDALLNKRDFKAKLRAYGKLYKTSYGMGFYKWLNDENSTPYNSYGNGSAMRVSSVAYFCSSEEEALALAKETAEITHNHIEGIKGSQAVTLAIFMALRGESKESIRNKISEMFNYDLSKNVSQIKPSYHFNETCQKTVPEAICCFLDSNNYESAIRNAIGLGGDADTLACITGSIAEAFYKELPYSLIEKVYPLLPDEFLNIIVDFYKRSPFKIAYI